MVVKITNFIDSAGEKENGKFVLKKEAYESFNSFLDLDFLSLI